MEEKVVNWPQSLLRDLRHLVNNISIINSLQSFGQRAEDSTSLRHLPQLALQKYLCTDEGKGQACFTKTADQELQPISNFGSPGGNCAKLGREHNCFWTWQCKGQTIAGFCPWFQRGGQSSRDRKTIWPWTLALYWLHNQSHRWDHKREESVSACCKALLESTANIGAFWPNHRPYFLLNRNLIGNFYCDTHSYVAHLICSFCTYANISSP